MWPEETLQEAWVLGSPSGGPRPGGAPSGGPGAPQKAWVWGYVPSGGLGPGGMSPRALNTALLSSMDDLGSSFLCPFSAPTLGRGQKA